MSVEVIYIIIVTYLLSEAIFIQIGKTKSKDPFGPQVYGLCLPLILFIVVLRYGQIIFGFLRLFFTLKANKSLPLSKIMKKQLFCVMNPFDEMCDQKDIDCLTMAFLDNRQFVGKTVRRVFKLILQIVYRPSLNHMGHVIRINLKTNKSPKAGFMNVLTEGTLPGLNPLASQLACIFFLDKDTYFNIDNINVEGKAYNFVKLIQGIDLSSQFV